MQSLHTRKAARKHTPQCQRGVCWQRCTCLNVRWAPVRLRRNKRLPQTLMTQRGSPAASAMTQQANVGNTKKSLQNLQTEKTQTQHPAWSSAQIWGRFA